MITTSYPMVGDTLFQSKQHLHRYWIVQVHQPLSVSGPVEGRSDPVQVRALPPVFPCYYHMFWERM